MYTCYLTYFLGMEYVVSKAELIPCKLLLWLKSPTVFFKYFNGDSFLLASGVDTTSACDIIKCYRLSTVLTNDDTDGSAGGNFFKVLLTQTTDLLLTLAVFNFCLFTVTSISL